MFVNLYKNILINLYMNDDSDILHYIEMFPSLEVDVIRLIYNQNKNNSNILEYFIELSNIEKKINNSENKINDDNIMSSFENTSVNCKSKNKSTSKQSFLSKKIFGKKKYNRLDND